jgi:GntR family transcriptional regulator
VRGLQIGAVKQTLTIGIADVETAMLLSISLNAPVACIQRVALDQDGVVVLLTDGIYRGDVVKLEMNLKTPTGGFPDANAR